MSSSSFIFAFFVAMAAIVNPYKKDLKSFKQVAKRHSREVQKQAWIEYKNSDHPFNSKYIRSGKPPGLYLLFDVLEKYGADYLQADTLACIYDTHGPIGHCELYLYDSESHSYHVFRRSGKGIQSEQYTGGETWYDDTPRMLLDMFRAKKYGELLNPDNYNNLILDSLGGYTIEVFIKEGKAYRISMHQYLGNELRNLERERREEQMRQMGKE